MKGAGAAGGGGEGETKGCRLLDMLGNMTGMRQTSKSEGEKGRGGGGTAGAHIAQWP